MPASRICCVSSRFNVKITGKVFQSGVEIRPGVHRRERLRFKAGAKIERDLEARNSLRDQMPD